MSPDYPVLVETTPLRCVECGRGWEDGSERWRLKVLFEEQPPEAVPYCPECHAHEFER
ncbi:MAG TPA: hypothetical protein VFL60_02725 [Gaiellaceae bacterium]|nr:hypothetical protein [Gaiellaceae bacterium]